jgi:hypothetical protein
MGQKLINMDLTAGMITKFALIKLESKGYYVWRNNNLSVPGRKFIGERGVADITGFCKTSGKAVYCEVKTIKDKLSDFQIVFLNRAKNAGALCYLATDNKGIPELNEWV